jgi:hypothetical protein
MFFGAKMNQHSEEFIENQLRSTAESVLRRPIDVSVVMTSE